MKLVEYLNENFLSINAFSRISGLSYQTINRILRKSPTLPQPETMKIIYEITKGKVDLRKESDK